jgi:hypothetical protein
MPHDPDYRFIPGLRGTSPHSTLLNGFATTVTL